MSIPDVLHAGVGENISVSIFDYDLPIHVSAKIEFRGNIVATSSGQITRRNFWIKYFEKWYLCPVFARKKLTSNLTDLYITPTLAGLAINNVSLKSYYSMFQRGSINIVAPQGISGKALRRDKKYLKLVS